ncbi:serine protease snake-like [Schistocerca serialis cubense]|uniref:serine protease snake-like n=1 Tax=Schistocerca serialis cubense TaxID=2023355 RepID=UPI00214EB2B5|nr:serine protease snake-like [Schistocerca serialis cubense]
MHALWLLATLSALLCGTAHAQWNLPSRRVGIGSSCTLNDGRQGVCKKFEQCREAIEELRKGIQPTTCFFDGFVAVPCCPVKGLSTPSTPETPPRVTTPSRPIPTPTRQPTQGQPSSCHDPIEDWSPSPAEERSLLQLAQQKCVEYRQHVYQLVQDPILIDNPGLLNLSTCGMDREPLIVGGVPASPREFPHMAVIGYGDGKTSWQCGGSLISSRHILTAAHCVTSPSAGCARRVLLGALLLNETNTNTEPQEFNIVRRIRHPRYNPPKRYNDIAIFELDRDVSFTGFVRPACLYDTFAPPTYDKGIATGFGRQDWLDREGSNELMKVTLPFQPFSECNGTYRANFRLPNGIDDNGMLCAGDPRGSKDTCQGDSGGPLQVRDIEHCMYKIIGVTSFGSSVCGAENTPAIYTRVSSYVPWIAKIVWT